MQKMILRLTHEALSGLLGLPGHAKVVQVLQRLAGEDADDTCLIKVYGEGPEVKEGERIPIVAWESPKDENSASP